MTHSRVDELLQSYHSMEDRCRELRVEIAFLEESLRVNERSMVSDQVSMSQAITGMPHGSSVGDPVGRLALNIAMGKVSVFVRQIQEELQDAYAEQSHLKELISQVDSWLDALSEPERTLVRMKAVNQESWRDIVRYFRKQFDGSYSKHSMQRIFIRAMDIIYEMA